MSQPAFNPFDKTHEFDKSSKGPDTNELREKERQKELKQKGKADRTEEYLDAIKVINEINPIEVNAEVIQDTILEDKLDFANKSLQFRKHCDRNKIPYNESDPTQDTNSKKHVVSLQDMPEGDARTQLNANIYADELEKTARIFQKKAADARNRHYFPTDRQEQNEMILGAKAWNRYLEPMTNDKFTGDWSDMFDHFVKELRRSNKDWTENPYFDRETTMELL